jgi:hypothetical protein
MSAELPHLGICALVKPVIQVEDPAGKIDMRKGELRLGFPVQLATLVTLKTADKVAETLANARSVGSHF